MPCVARDWKVSDDGKVIIIFLRKGLKWSDGQPFTADDFVFWYEDVYLNKDIQPAPHPDFMVNGKSGRLYKRDDYTVVFEFPEPNYLFVDILAGSTAMGGGQATQQYRRPHHGRLHAGPLPEAVPPEVRGRKDELDRKAKAAGLRRLAELPQEPLGLAPEPGAAGPHPLEDGDPDQHADLGAGAEPVLLRGRHPGEPAPVHRSDLAWGWPRTWRW